MPSHGPLSRPARAGSLVLFAACLIFSGCTTNLNKAISRDNPKAVDKYLGSGSDVNAADKEGATPLINAAQFGDLALIQKLVARGAKVNAVDHTGNSALCYLVSGDTYKNEAVAFLLAHGADVNHANYRGQAPIILASARSCEASAADSQVELLSILVKSGARIDEQGPSGELPLHLAAFAGQPDKALDFLLHATKDPHALSFTGYSVFTEAARGDHRDAGLFLAAAGFEPKMLVPGTPNLAVFPPTLDPSFPINARCLYFYGDYLAAHGRGADALANYKGSASSFDAAVAEYRQVIASYNKALKDEKSARTGRIMKFIAVDALGVGLAAATGVGFVAIPKRSVNNIDTYEDELDTDNAELGVLTREQAEVQAKISGAQSAPAAPPAAGS